MRLCKLAQRSLVPIVQAQRLVKDCYDQERNIPEQSPRPTQLSQEEETGKAYKSVEALTVCDNQIAWNDESYKIFARIRGLEKIDQSFVRRVFGVHNGIDYRAVSRVKEDTTIWLH